MSIAPLEQALYHFEHRDNYDMTQKIDAAVELGEWGIYSSRQIANILGMNNKTVGQLSPKTDRTGGRLNPETLRPLLNVAQARARGEVDIFEVRKALNGTSSYMASTLTGIPRTTLERQASKAEGMVGNE